MRQAVESGVKNFSVISSVGAIWDRKNLKPSYTSDGAPMPKRHVSVDTDFILLDRLESSYERGNSLRSP